MLPCFNHGPQCLCLGWLRCQGIHLKLREGVQRMVALRLVAQPPPQSARYLPPWGVPTHRPLMTTSPQMEVWWTPPPAGKGKEATGAEEAEAERARTALTPSDPPPLAEAEGRRVWWEKGHSGEVTDAFRQWARCITYYRDYYEDFYLMPLVVSSLTGDASDVFDWILSLNQGKPQDLMTLLQMLREHYCGSLTFREQRNAIESLCQKSNEAAIDFLIRVGTSVSNLAKDWKDELRECELQALQNEVLLNGVKEEIRHVLDSEMAKRDSRLTPQQMYEAIKKYKTYVARNRRLDGKGISTPAGQQKATGQSLGYKPQFHKTTAFVATAGGLNDESDHPPGEESDSHEVEPPPKEDVATLRRLYQTTPLCKSRWPVPCEFRR